MCFATAFGRQMVRGVHAMVRRIMMGIVWSAVLFGFGNWGDKCKQYGYGIQQSDGDLNYIITGAFFLEFFFV